MHRNVFSQTSSECEGEQALVIRASVPISHTSIGSLYRAVNVTAMICSGSAHSEKTIARNVNKAPFEMRTSFSVVVDSESFFLNQIIIKV